MARLTFLTCHVHCLLPMEYLGPILSWVNEHTTAKFHSHHFWILAVFLEISQPLILKLLSMIWTEGVLEHVYQDQLCISPPCTKRVCQGKIEPALNQSRRRLAVPFLLLCSFPQPGVPGNGWLSQVPHPPNHRTLGPLQSKVDPSFLQVHNVNNAFKYDLNIKSTSIS